MAPEPGGNSSPWRYLIAISMLQTFASLAHSSFAPLGDLLQRDMGLSSAQLGALPLAAFTGSMLTTVVSGWLIDRYNVRPMILLGPTIMAASLVAVGATSTYWGLWMLLLVLGIGNGSITPLTSKAIAGWFPPRTRGLAMSIKQSGVTMGGAIGALLLPWVSAHYGWQAAFQTAGLLLAIVLVYSYLSYNDPPHRPAAVATGHAAVRIGTVVRDPLLITILLMGFFYCGYQLSIQTFYMPYLIQSVGLPSYTAATYLFLLQIGGVLGRPFLGIWSDRTGQRLPLLVLLGVASAAGGFFLWLFPDPAPWLLVVLTLFIGMSIFGWVGLQFALITERAPESMAGRLIGVGAMLNVGGAAVGPMVFGALIDSTGSYSWSLASFSAIVLGVALLLKVAPRWFARPVFDPSHPGSTTLHAPRH